MIHGRSAAAISLGVAAVLLGARMNAREIDDANRHRTALAPAWRFTPRVGGIPVSDSAGVALEVPFLGGFDVPRPQLVDINGDGRLDLFVQERSGELIYFERTGDRWEWRSDRFLGIDIGEWFRFVDLDRDSVTDLLSEMRAGYIRAWRNVGTRREPRLVALGDTVRDVDGRALAADRQNILNAVDIDCNGKLDLMLGRVQGTVDRYEQEGSSPDGSPRFRLVEPMWQGIEVLGPEATGGSVIRDTTHGPHVIDDVPRHGANTLAFADVNGNGVLDLFWGDFFEQGLLRFENTGSCAQPDFTGKPARFPAGMPVLTSGYNAPSFGDVDGDGLIDMVMGVIGGAYGPTRTSIDNLYLVRQRAKNDWRQERTRLIRMIDVGSESTPVLADVNGDALLDLIVGSKMDPSADTTGTLTWYANVGSATQPSFREQGRLRIAGQYNYAPAVGDLNGDSLPDLILGTWTDRVQWYRNTGTRSTPSWVLADTALVTITRGTNATPAVGDVDGDGLLDLMIGEGSGTLNFYRNTGTRSAPRFTLVSDAFQEINVGRRSAPLLADLDRDGRLDLLVGNDAGALRLWHRVGAGSNARFETDSSFSLSSPGLAAPAAGDLRGTGRMDLLVGTASGGLRWFANDTPP